MSNTEHQVPENIQETTKAIVSEFIEEKAQVQKQIQEKAQAEFQKKISWTENIPWV